jgi:hypothetical protein
MVGRKIDHFLSNNVEPSAGKSISSFNGDLGRDDGGATLVRTAKLLATKLPTDRKAITDYKSLWFRSG